MAVNSTQQVQWFSHFSSKSPSATHGKPKIVPYSKVDVSQSNSWNRHSIPVDFSSISQRYRGNILSMKVLVFFLLPSSTSSSDWNACWECCSSFSCTSLSRRYPSWLIPFAASRHHHWIARLILSLSIFSTEQLEGKLLFRS